MREGKAAKRAQRAEAAAAEGLEDDDDELDDEQPDDDPDDVPTDEPDDDADANDKPDAEETTTTRSPWTWTRMRMPTSLLSDGGNRSSSRRWSA